ncbi:MAG: hypothetical protein KKE44_18395 [Proteobacteria bacterium]|nr:hypothetical protein [Pseudomonadota bacterium]MBU1584704.1 hypothetical protein [Pseudomonadota bacterium]MBU2627849.1 hypothetical protein [Pseudomonadota bacterium]
MLFFIQKNGGIIFNGLLFTHFYATGTRTVRGLEAITLFLPPTPGRSVAKRPDNGHMYSLGKESKIFGICRSLCQPCPCCPYLGVDPYLTWGINKKTIQKD